MENSFVSCDAKKFRGQFLLTAENGLANEGWKCTTFKEWKLFTSDLPIIDVYNEKSKWIGWCIGHPIVDGILVPEKVVLKKSSNAVDPYENFYDRTTGKWALLLLDDEVPVIYLDPYGSLTAVFSTDKETIASTPTLIGTDADWDKELMAEIGFPESIHWLPSGLTFKKRVRRIIANHRFHLSDWKTVRHWPNKETNLSIDADTDAAAEKVMANIQTTIAATASKFPLCLTITGGMDSRVVLACARNQVNQAKIITFAEAHETLDMYLAKRLAKQLNLNHQFLPILKANPEELEQWLYMTGNSVAGDIWKIHKTLSQLDADRVLMSGQSGEVHRGNYWRPGDTAEMKITPEMLLKRTKFPQHPVLLKASEEWLAEFENLTAFNILDLVHIEQRMACWGAIQAYGNSTSVFEISPLSSRLIFQTMMRLPHPYRKRQQLPYDICKKAWPDLLKLPFNEYPGLYGYFRSKAKKVKKMYKRMVE